MERKRLRQGKGRERRKKRGRRRKRIKRTRRTARRRRTTVTTTETRRKKRTRTLRQDSQFLGCRGAKLGETENNQRVFSNVSPFLSREGGRGRGVRGGGGYCLFWTPRKITASYETEDLHSHRRHSPLP